MTYPNFCAKIFKKSVVFAKKSGKARYFWTKMCIFAANKTTKQIVMNKKIVFALLTAVVLLGGGIAGWMVWNMLAVEPVIHEGTWVYIHDGKVEPADALNNRALGWALNHYDYEEKLKSGKLDGAYYLEPNSSALVVARKISRHQQTPIKLTFNNIRLKEQWAGHVAERLMCDSTEVMQAMLDPDFLKEAEVDEENVIGLLLPDTYEVYWNISASELMQKMLKEYRRFWNEARQQKAESLGLTPQEVVTLGSIAEEETQNRSERGTVGMLYWNRLQMMMPLQADPTVKFALKDFGLKRILNVHLEVESPYNTYKYEGLPPGPIRMVEKATIDTILNAHMHPYLYMCAKPDFSGRHNFATTYSQHLRNAAAYHAALDAKK